MFLRNNFRTPIKGPCPDDWVPFLTPFRFTASEIYCLTGRSQYKSRGAYLGEVLGLIPRMFCGNEHTRRGERLEPAVRRRYEVSHGTVVEEVGFIVPRWCPYIGVSPDGLTDEGCVEIKCPVCVWPDLKETGTVKPEHYAQMQMTMEICDRPWCDYLVYSERDDEYYEHRVMRDPAYWADVLHPAIDEAIAQGRKLVASETIHDYVI